MKKYVVDYTDKAKNDIATLKESGNKSSTQKLNRLLKELIEHPKTGTGKPEYLKHKKCWSRRINKEHRLCYEIYDDVVVVLVLSAFGHYDNN